MTVVPVVDAPSPKVHVIEYGAVPPVVVLAKVMVEFTWALVGLAVVFDGEEESVAVSVTVKV